MTATIENEMEFSSKSVEAHEQCEMTRIAKGDVEKDLEKHLVKLEDVVAVTSGI